MKIKEREFAHIRDGLIKLERVFAYKYEVPRASVTLLIHRQTVHVMIEGKLKQSFALSLIKGFKINERTGYVFAGPEHPAG